MRREHSLVTNGCLEVQGNGVCGVWQFSKLLISSHASSKFEKPTSPRTRVFRAEIPLTL